MLTCLSFTVIVCVDVVIVTKVVAPPGFNAAIINDVTVVVLVVTKTQPANARPLLLFRNSH